MCIGGQAEATESGLNNNTKKRLKQALGACFFHIIE